MLRLRSLQPCTASLAKSYYYFSYISKCTKTFLEMTQSKKFSCSEEYNRILGVLEIPLCFEDFLHVSEIFQEFFAENLTCQFKVFSAHLFSLAVPSDHLF